jgi:hypothetical protein
MMSSPEDGFVGPKMPIVTPEKAPPPRQQIRNAPRVEAATSDEEDEKKPTRKEAAGDHHCHSCYEIAPAEDIFYTCIVCVKTYCLVCNQKGMVENPVHCPGCDQQACDDCAPICRECGGGNECDQCFYEAHECSF